MDSLGMKGWFDISKISPTGEKESFHIPNTIVADGKSCLASMLGSDNASAVAFDWIAIGSGTDAAVVTQTALVHEAYGRVDASGAVIGSLCTFTGSFGISGTFTSSEYGIFNATSAGSMLCRASGTGVSLTSGDYLTITYNVIVG